jgi:hypothetical protein
MLRPRHTLTRVILVTAAWALMAGAFASSAAADGGGEPEENFVVDVTVDTTEGGVSAGSATASCMNGSAPISCTGPDGGWWNDYKKCYAEVLSDDPNDQDPGAKYYWDLYGATSGVLMQCASSPYQVIMVSSVPWVETYFPPSLEDLTNQVYLLVNGVITAPQIGIFPGDLEENNPDAMGLVGVPTWYWSKNPGPGIAAPWTGSVTVGKDTLNVTAALDKTVWDAGDGGQVVCGLGTKAYNIHRPTPSPSRCDHIYMERARYTVTATTHVNVTWNGGGYRGSFTLSVQRSGVYRVGEIQVVNVYR